MGGLTGVISDILHWALVAFCIKGFPIFSFSRPEIPIKVAKPSMAALELFFFFPSFPVFCAILREKQKPDKKIRDREKQSKDMDKKL